MRPGTWWSPPPETYLTPPSPTSPPISHSGGRAAAGCSSGPAPWPCSPSAV
ncbi:hypothetical protein ACFFX0_32605 [Citricoccus parietis]|uniref:Uncharacterized protein n=1 Tax=Citricoccus parietis TaxID=592307 RepID=A0ABV5G9P6_9MICC